MTLLEKYLEKGLFLKEAEEKVKEILKSRSEGLKRAWAKETPKEREARLANARAANKGAKRSKETREKMKEANLKYRKDNPSEIKEKYKRVFQTLKNKSEEEKKEIKEKQSNTHKKRWKKFGGTLECLERNKKISQKLTGRKRSKESIEKQRQANLGKKKSKETKLKLAETRRLKAERGESLGVRCKFYKVGNFMCQGRWEKMYIENLYEKKLPLPNKRGSFVETPDGVYHPDFEFEDYFIEIKSPFTYEIFNGTKPNIDGLFNKKQKEKVEWTSKNYKLVKILVLNNKGKIIKEEIL